MIGSRQNCRGANRKLLWQFTVVIKFDPVDHEILTAWEYAKSPGRR